MRNWIRSVCCLVSASFFAPALPGLAQGNVASARVPEAAASTTVLAAPRQHEAMTVRLRRPVSLKLDNATLAAVLEEIDRQAELGLVYSSRVVPLGRRVTVELRGVAAEDALREVLRGTDVDVAVTLAGQIVLVKRATPDAKGDSGGTVTGRVTDAKSGKPVPNASVFLEGTRWRASTGGDGAYRLIDVTAGSYTLTASRIGYAKQSRSVTVAAGQEVTVDLALGAAATELEQVVVTGTVVPTERKAIPTPISVITSDDIERLNLQRVDQVFRGTVPGAIAWDQGPLDWFSVIATRGASTLSATPSIKTLVDGVEMADPLDVAEVDPNSIERVEITRGPQASTMYGSGALSGVMQIFTKQGLVGLAHPQVTGKASAGSVGGFDGSGTVLQTDNAISVLGGSDSASYNVGVSYRRVGEWVPSYGSSEWGVSLGGRMSRGLFTVSGSARYSERRVGDAWDTRFQSYTDFSKPSYLARSIQRNTYGVTAAVQATPRWHHTLTLGYDQTYYSDYQTQPRLTTPADSLLSSSWSHEAKASLLYHTDLSIPLGIGSAATVTAGVDYDGYDQLFTSSFGATRTTGSLNGSISAVRRPTTNTGYFSQIEVSVADQLFLTGGLRAERNPGFGANYGTAFSPRVGAAYVFGVGTATLKLRASYGESIRAPALGLGDALKSSNFQILANPQLGPERQRGTDGGVEVYLGRASVGVTYYNQRAIGLLQRVTIPSAPPPLAFQWQNIARVHNEGWEFEGHLPLGLLQLAGTYSITTSTVQELPANYPAGGYQIGDRIQGIPHTSAGAAVTFAPLHGTTLSANMTLIGHWIAYDYVALFGYYFGSDSYRGSDRAYWIEYPTVTKFAVSASQELTKSLTAFVRADNVGNSRRYEQDNTYLPRTRSVTFGAKISP